MAQTGPVCDCLSFRTDRRIIGKLTAFVKNNMISDVTLSWVKDSMQNELLQKMGKNDFQEVMEALSKLSALNDEAGVAASQLYIMAWESKLAKDNKFK